MSAVTYGSGTCRGLCQGQSLSLMMSEKYLIPVPHSAPNSPNSYAPYYSQLPAWPEEATLCLGTSGQNVRAYLSWKRSWVPACLFLPCDPGQDPSLPLASISPCVWWGGRTRGFLRCQQVFTPSNDDPYQLSATPTPHTGAVEGGTDRTPEP